MILFFFVIGIAYDINMGLKPSLKIKIEICRLNYIKNS